MGVKKAAKKSTAKKTSIVSKAAKTVTSALSAVSGKRSPGVRRHRVTPEKLAKQILILKLKKRLYKMKYGGR